MEWNNLPWREIEKVVFKLQKRIYQASKDGNIKAVSKRRGNYPGTPRTNLEILHRHCHDYIHKQRYA
nr:reverse transcriptase N-terminal domain-containing protein [Cyanobacterium aponinum]